MMKLFNYPAVANQIRDIFQTENSKFFLKVYKIYKIAKIKLLVLMIWVHYSLTIDFN
jgi:hypothetical protein